MVRTTDSNDATKRLTSTQLFLDSFAELTGGDEDALARRGVAFLVELRRGGVLDPRLRRRFRNWSRPRVTMSVARALARNGYLAAMLAAMTAHRPHNP